MDKEIISFNTDSGLKLSIVEDKKIFIKVTSLESESEGALSNINE